MEIFNPFAENQQQQQQQPEPNEDAMDIESGGNYRYDWVNFNWHAGLNIIANKYGDADIFKRIHTKNHSHQVTQLFVFMLECYLKSPMRGPMMDPEVSTNYMKQMVDQMSTSPDCWNWECFPPAQRRMYKNLDIKLTNPFNLIDTDAEWSSILQHTATSSILCRTHHYVHKLQLVTARRMVEFFFNFISTEEQPTINVNHFPMLKSLTTDWKDDTASLSDTLIRELVQTLFEAGNMVFVPQFIKTLGTFAIDGPNALVMNQYLCDFPLNLRMLEHGQPTTHVYLSHYFPYDEDVGNTMQTAWNMIHSLLSELFLSGTLSMIKSHGYTSITLDQDRARTSMVPTMTFDAYKDHVWNVQQMYFELVKPFYTINYSKDVIGLLENPKLTETKRDSITFQMSTFNNLDDNDNVHLTSTYLESDRILPHFWEHQKQESRPCRAMLFTSQIERIDDKAASMVTILFRMIENNQLEMILWMARQLLVVTNSAKTAAIYKYRNISFAYAQINFFQNLIWAIQRIRNRSIVTYLQWANHWIYDLFVANLQENCSHGNVFETVPYFGILANKSFAVWLALTWIGSYDGKITKLKNGMLFQMSPRNWQHTMDTFFMDLIYPVDSISYSLESSIHYIELVHYLRESLQFHTILPMTEGGAKAGFNGLELTIDTIPNPSNELHIYNPNDLRSGHRTLPQLCYHGVMAAINADLYNTILYRNAPTNPKMPLTLWALEFFHWTTPLNRTVIDFNFLTIDGFNANSIMTNPAHKEKIRERLQMHTEPESEAVISDYDETLTSLAAVFSLVDIMANLNLPVPRHLKQLYLDPRQRALYSASAAVPNSLFEFLFSVAFPGCSIDAIMSPLMVDFSALTDNYTFLSPNIVNGNISLPIANNRPQPISLVVGYKKLKKVMTLWNKLTVSVGQTWMLLWSQLFSWKNHTSTHVMDLTVEHRTYSMSKRFAYAKCWVNPIDDNNTPSVEQLAILKKIMMLPNNLLHFFGELKSTAREAAMERLITQNPNAVNTPMVLRETLGRLFIWMHLNAYVKILSVNAPTSQSALIPWANLGSGTKLLFWLHSTYCAPNVTSITEMFEYNKPAASSDSIADLERHFRNCYNRSFINGQEHGPPIIPMAKHMYEALGYNNYQQFTFLRDNYQLQFKATTFKKYMEERGDPHSNNHNSLLFNWSSKIQTHQYVAVLNNRLPRSRLNQLNIPPNCGPQPIVNLTPKEYQNQLLNFKRKRDKHNKELAAATSDTIIVSSIGKQEKKKAAALKRKIQLMTNVEDEIEEFDKRLKRARHLMDDDEEEEESTPSNQEESDNQMQVDDDDNNNNNVVALNNVMDDMDLFQWLNS